VVPESFNFSVLHSFIVFGGWWSHFRFVSLSLFFLKEWCLFSRCLNLRCSCGYCGWRFCDCWFFEGRWYCE